MLTLDQVQMIANKPYLASLLLLPNQKQLREHEAEDAYHRRLQESIDEEEERLGPYCPPAGA